ncbi:STE20-related kinase adapter protein alpha isoform X1 [Phlebotomus argentipes]|uniref:STE20-related kinase adapter protein alpha isoform X1 n=1 Tax=Phlebotomus argentipes TaxID=94469 RepID=UPI00289358A0|nr:STE20-related kinase adapter protein alpha isoform X1 [Phlebotomus argentipes]
MLQWDSVCLSRQAHFWPIGGHEEVPNGQGEGRKCCYSSELLLFLLFSCTLSSGFGCFPPQDEILIMRQFNHPNILSFFTAFVDNFDVFVIAPFIPFGSCRDTMTNSCVTGFPEIVVVLIVKDILHGLEYLHKKGFIHRAIRASHILLSHDRAVITGFRQAISLLSHGERVRSLHNLPGNATKGLNWLAPELLEQNLLGYTEKSDIYSVGIATCELCNGIEPFANMPTTYMLTEKIRGNQPTLLDFSTLPSEEMIVQGVDPTDTFMAQARKIYSQKKLSDNIHKFAEVCMQRQPGDRPSVCQLFNHPVFKQTKHTTLSEQLTNFSIQAVDYSRHCDENLKLVQDLSDMNLSTGSAFEWDF